MSIKQTTKLRNMLRSGKLVVAPFCPDALTAVIAERVGFEAVYMTGHGTAATLLGKADVGLTTMTEMVTNARYIASAVSVPVIADADAGFGNPINVWRTVQEYERAGVAAIHIEDQQLPKKCGLFEGKKVIPRDDAVAKFRAAVDARSDPDFVIIARTDALALNGWEDTIERVRSYADAGADMILVHDVFSKEDYDTLFRCLGDLPLVGGGMPKRLEELGFFKICLCVGVPAQHIAYVAIRECFEELKNTGEVAGLREKLQRYESINAVLGLDRIYEMEKTYGVV